jgi:hypothetical protein
MRGGESQGVQQCAGLPDEDEPGPIGNHVSSSGLVDTAGVKAYLVCSTCSPLDQPQGLLRGFEFQGHLDAA